MRSITWGRPLIFNVVTHDSRHYFVRGYRAGISGHVAAIYRSKTAEWLAANRAIMTSAFAKLGRLAEQLDVSISDVQQLAEEVTRSTGRMTLYHPGIDAQRLLQDIDESEALKAHVASVLATYQTSFTRTANLFLASEAAIPLMEYFDYVEHNGAWHLTSRLHSCALCEDPIFPDEDEYVVYEDADCEDGYDAHRGCCHSGNYTVQFCPLTGTWFDTDHLEFVYVEDYDRDVCVDAAVNRGLVVEDEDYDGNAVYRLVRASNSSPRRSSRLASYHGAPRAWRAGGPIPNGHIGVELELGFTHGESARNQFLEKYVGTDGRALSGPFIFERDGSLDSIPGGMEIISEPLPIFIGYQSKDAPWRTLLKNLYDAGAAGWKYRKEAGIHVNLCVADESDASLFKYASFIGNAEAMSKFIAGRKNIFGTESGYMKTPPHLLRGANPQPQMESQFAHGKYCAVNRRDRTCLETRIFGSNIRYEGFMACVEYCVAVMEFVRPLHILDVSSPTIAGEFRNWLGSATGRFPNLTARLGIVAHPLGTATPSTTRVVPALLAA